MGLRPGTHKFDRDSGTLQVCTFREGVAQKIGHDLTIDVERWEAQVEVGHDGTPWAVRLEADARSLDVREGLHGVKPLSEKDRAEISKTIDEKILGGQPIAFRSSALERHDGLMTVRGDLTIAGTTRPASFEMDLMEDGRGSGTLPVTAVLLFRFDPQARPLGADGRLEGARAPARSKKREAVTSCDLSENSSVATT